MDELLNKALYGILFFNGVVFIIALLNLRTIPRLESVTGWQYLPPASILVPARNEADGIIACLKSLLSQNYPNYELLVLDDHSTDGTADLVSLLAHENPKLKLLSGQSIPEGWLGKNWACHQLSESATGEFLLFTDADTIHHPDSLRDGAQLLKSSSVDMLSALPLEEIDSWSERLTIPTIVWVLVALIPHQFARRIRLPFISGAIGQYILFRRETYLKIGGHQAIKDQVVDDIALARRVRAAGVRMLLADGTRRIHCRMYTNWHEVVDGLGKNLFAVFDRRFLAYTFAWLWLLFCAWLPLAFLLEAGMGMEFYYHRSLLALLTVVISMLTWWRVLSRFGLPRGLALAFPLILLCTAALAFLSAGLLTTGKATWKGRRLPAKGIL